MENIDIKDYFKISDDHSEVRGFLEVKDENGRTLFVKENMVTSAGRMYIKNLCFNAFTNGSDTPLTFNGIKFGSDGSITTTNMINLKDSSTNIEFSINGTSDFGLYSLDISSNDTEHNIKITLTLTTSESANKIFREAGLFLSDGSMFSRVAFAPLTIKPNYTYTINYYIYF